MAGGLCHQYATGIEVKVLELGVAIFDLCSPAVVQRRFDTGTGNPAVQAPVEAEADIGEDAAETEPGDGQAAAPGNA